MEKHLEALIRENEELKEILEDQRVKLCELQEENKSLWSMLEEQKKSDNAIGQTLETMLRESLEEQLLLSMEPVGDA
jgi:predicted nuclease with TOPRIM domain